MNVGNYLSCASPAMLSFALGNLHRPVSGAPPDRYPGAVSEGRVGSESTAFKQRGIIND